MQPGDFFNPFPGLRAFEPEEDYLFFGRERVTDELLKRLRTTRFSVVTGASGSGKSSIVRSGLIPSLYRGFMAGAGSSWRVSLFRPGANPLQRLTSSISDILGVHDERALTFTRITLERGSLGLVEAVEQAKIPANENILVVVDQFEELFRFQTRGDSEKPNDEAVAFVKLLLEAARQEVIPIYIVITIRADYLGHCMRYPSLPEAVNTGQYLVPRMTRDELRRAITGPVAVGGGEIAPRLVIRLLNDAGDDPEQLPVLQHALMRTWDYWEHHRNGDEPIDNQHYDAIGTMKDALSMHADEAYSEAESIGMGPLAETIFKALTDTSTNPNGVRRPAPVRDLAAIAGRPESEIVSTVEIFQRAGRSFLTPPGGTPMESSTVVDLAHESLMRGWSRLKEWTEQERISAERYLRIARAARWFEEGTAGLWRDPELGMGLKWRRENHPTAAWAQRWDPRFDLAMTFLDRSEEERNRLLAAQENARRRKLALAWVVATVLGVLLVFSYRATRAARRNLDTAERAVNTVASFGNESSQFASEPAAVREFRARLMTQADEFYKEFRKDDPVNARVYVALEHFHKGDIERLLDNVSQAIPEYNTAIEQFNGLVLDFPQTPEYRERAALAYNWLAECERFLRSFEDAIKHYSASLEILDKLRHDFPTEGVYGWESARTRDNRGIAYSQSNQSKLANEDFITAIDVLNHLTEHNSRPEYRQELGRAKNNLANWMRYNQPSGSIRDLFEGAIQIGTNLLTEHARNREYELELAKYHSSFALYLHDIRDDTQAKNENARSIELLDDLAASEPSLELELAHTHAIHARILARMGAIGAAKLEYSNALEGFEKLNNRRAPAEYHGWYGEALASAAFLAQRNDSREAVRLFSAALEQHRAAGDNTNLAWDFYYLAGAYRMLGSAAQEKDAIKQLNDLLPRLSEADRNELAEQLQSLKGQK